MEKPTGGIGSKIGEDGHAPGASWSQKQSLIRKILMRTEKVIKSFKMKSQIAPPWEASNPHSL